MKSHEEPDRHADPPTHGFERLDAGELDAELAATEDLFGAELRALLDPDVGLAERTRRDVNASLVARSALAVSVDLLTVGWHAARLLFGPPDGSSLRSQPIPHQETSP